MTKKSGIERMVEIEKFVSRFVSFLAANKVRLKVERKSDERLTPEDEVVYLVFDEDDTMLRVTEHDSDWMEAFVWHPGRNQPQGPRLTGHDRADVVTKIGYLA